MVQGSSEEPLPVDHHQLSLKLTDCRFLHETKMKRSNRRALDVRSPEPVLALAKTKFGVSIDDEIVQEMDKLVNECADLGASRSEIVEAVLTAYLESELSTNHRLNQLVLRSEPNPRIGR